MPKINVKRKGNKGENKFYQWLRQEKIDKQAMRNPSSGAGAIKSDVINSLGINFEVKTVKKIGLQKAWQQSDKDALKSHSIPYLVIHFDGMPEDMWFIVIDNWHWKDLWLKSREDKMVEPSRELKYSLEKLKYCINQILRLIK